MVRKNGYPRPVVAIVKIPPQLRWILVSIRAVWDEEEQAHVAEAKDAIEHATMIFQLEKNLPNDAKWYHIADSDTIAYGKHLKSLHDAYAEEYRQEVIRKRGGK